VIRLCGLRLCRDAVAGAPHRREEENQATRAFEPFISKPLKSAFAINFRGKERKSLQKSEMFALTWTCRCSVSRVWFMDSHGHGTIWALLV
jgi:hypothetical protein